MGLISRVSSRTYRKKNQKNIRQTWPLAKTSVSQKDPKREVRRRSSTHSPKRTGTPSKPQPSSKSETSATPWSPEPSVTRSPLMDLKDESTTATKPTSTTTVKDTENSNCLRRCPRQKLHLELPRYVSHPRQDVRYGQKMANYDPVRRRCQNHR